MVIFSLVLEPSKAALTLTARRRKLFFPSDSARWYFVVFGRARLICPAASRATSGAAQRDLLEKKITVQPRPEWLLYLTSGEKTKNVADVTQFPILKNSVKFSFKPEGGAF